jgi:hypothetical protein
VLIGLSIVGTAAAWGPHSEITRAGISALPNRPEWRRFFGDEWERLADYSWIPDWQSDVHYGVYSDDFLIFPALPKHVSHMVPESKATFAPLFRRCLQALRTENSFNAARWVGSLLHYIEDSGSPPHAAAIGGDLHFKMENWLDAKRIRLDGYEPQLLGRSDDEAVRGFEARMERLIAFSRERGLTLKPILEPLKDRQDQELILECALEVSRTVADSLHTLFTLGLTIVEPSGCELRGRVRIGDRERLVRTGARVMLAGTSFSTLTDLDGWFAFRNLPSGRCTVQVLATGAEFGTVTDLELQRDRPAECSIKLTADPAGDNVIRNARFALKWSSTETPDWWQRDEKNPRRWASLPAPIPHGTRLRLTVEFADKPVPIHIRWRGNGRVVNSGTTTLVEPADVVRDSKILTANLTADSSIKPAYEQSIFAEVLIESDQPLASVCRHIALVPISADK